jgi:hypothetical protein
MVMLLDETLIKKIIYQMITIEHNNIVINFTIEYYIYKEFSYKDHHYIEYSKHKLKII